MIETAVALAILALSLTVIYQSFSWTLRRSADQQHRDLAWLTALSLLDQMRRDPALSVGHRDGLSSRGLRWESLVENYAYPSEMPGGVFTPVNGSTVQLLQIHIAVRWGDSASRRIELQSIEFGIARWR